MACVSVSVCLFGCVKRKTRKRRGNVEMHNYTACCGLLLRKKKTKFTTWERVFDVRTAIVVDQSDGGDYPTTS